MKQRRFAWMLVLAVTVAAPAYSVSVPTGHLSGSSRFSMSTTGLLTLTGNAYFYPDAVTPDATTRMYGRLAITNSAESAIENWDTGNGQTYRGTLQFGASANRCYSAWFNAAIDMVAYYGVSITPIPIDSSNFDPLDGAMCYSPPPPPDPTCSGPCNDDSGWITACETGCVDPLVLDLNGDGINTTGLEAPVWFDLDGDGTKERMTWTNASTMEGFLWVNLTGKNRVDNGSELFGIGTVLPDGTKAQNGFEALAMYDQPAQGGNGDGVIDANDSVWNHLRVWVDANHDGVCDPSENKPLHAYGVDSIALDATPNTTPDAAGNVHRLRGHYSRHENGQQKFYAVESLNFQRVK